MAISVQYAGLLGVVTSVPVLEYVGLLGVVTSVPWPVLEYAGLLGVVTSVPVLGHTPYARLFGVATMSSMH